MSQADPSGPEPARMPVLYLAGIGRSGSTLLERLLGEVPGICSLGEVMHLWRRGLLLNERCGCSMPFRECSFWQQIGQEAFGGWDRVDAPRMTALARTVDDVAHLPKLLGAGHRAFAADLAEYVSAYEAVYRAARTVTGAQVVVDSSKATSLVYCLRTATGLDLQVLHVVRDSRGVAYSWTRKVRRPESTGAEGDYMPTFSPARVAVLWSGHNLLIQAVRALGTPVHLAPYEGFVADPKAFLRSVLHRCGIPADESTLAAAGADWVELSVSHQVSGNPMRFQAGRIPVRRDEAWRQALPATQRRVVTGLTAPVSGLLRYQSSGRPVGRR